MSWIKPRLAVLTEDQIARVHQDSLRVLADTGVRVDSPRAREVLVRAGCRIRDGERIRIPRELVCWALDVAADSVAIYDRLGSLAFRLAAQGEKGPRFGIGVTNLYFQDPGTDEVVPFTREHMALSTRLGNTLPSYDIISTIGILHDVPLERADLLATLEMIANTTKPLVILVSDDAMFGPVLDLLEHLGGDLTDRPFVLPYFNPITPLVINAGTCAKMFVAIERGLPIIYANYGMAGATAPITPAGTLALLNAELLAGLVLGQLIREGTPMILGSLPASFDMRAMLGYFGPETMLLNLACAEMMAHYGVPHCGTSGSGAGWGADLPASDLLWMNHLTACMGKVGLAPFVGGNFDSLVFSPALAVYGDHVIRQARRLARAFDLEDNSAALREIDRVGPAGNYLATDLTLGQYRQYMFESPIFPRHSLDSWRSRGEPRADDLLRQHTMEQLAEARVPTDHDEVIDRGTALIARWHTTGRPD